MGIHSIWATVRLTAILVAVPGAAWAEQAPAGAPPAGPAEPRAQAEPAPPPAPAQPTPPPALAQPATPTEAPAAATPEAAPFAAAPAWPPAAPPELGTTDERQKDEDRSPWDKRPKLSVHGLVHALFTAADRIDTPTYAFSINRARVALRWNQSRLIDGQLEFELAEEEAAGSTISGWAPLRDAFVRVSPDRALRVRMGQFKKPFGRLRLASVRELQLVRRGIVDDWIVETLGYGDRDLGLQVEGRLGRTPEFGYALGVFNGSGLNQKDTDLNGAKDFVGRVEFAPVRWLSIGLDGSYKRFDLNTHPGYPTNHGVMGGADFAIQTAGLYVLGEGMYGDNYLSLYGYPSWSLLLMAAYKIPLTSWWGLALEPVVKGELLKVEAELVRSHFVSGTLGANLHIGKYLRLMFQDEAVWSTENSPDLHQQNFGKSWLEQNRFFLQAALQTR
jgi:hypothetical protein